MNIKDIVYRQIPQPAFDCTSHPVMLHDQTMLERYERVQKQMEERDLDTLVIYADLEHGSNFEYLTGFLPRFEEALLILHRDKTNYMVMGNENLNKVACARLQAEAVHAPHFSLPNQPMECEEDFTSILKTTNIKHGTSIGLVGWKKFTSKHEDNQKLFDIPCYIVEAIQQLAGSASKIINAADIFIGEHGVRCTNNVNEIEHYEFGASLASDCMLNAMNRLDVGVSEMELGDELNAYGQKNSVVTIAAAGKRFTYANLYPTDQNVSIGDAISLTVGYKGGLSSRAGYAVHDEQELSLEAQDYLDALVKPYYHAVAAWLTNVRCSITGDEVYQLIESILPKADYHWHLCPGHLTADEEWLSSPIYEGSKEKLKSGMLFQLDIIPSKPGYAGVSAESTLALADESLRQQIKHDAPALWQRIQNRRAYIKDVLHIDLSADILPMCSTLGYLRPFLLSKEKAMALR